MRLARTGAQARVSELRRELETIYRMFPDLRRGRPARGETSTSERGTSGARRSRGRRGWTAAQRKAAAERMKKYWAARRSQKK